MLAGDVMTTRFTTLHPEDTITEAVNRFQAARREQGKNVFGLMVTDDADRLVGMLSMYDILLFVQPRHANIWQELADEEQAEAFGALLGRVKSIRVGDLMTTDVVTITPQTHLLTIVDIMIKRHIRRLPADTPLEAIMAGPLLTCFLDDGLEHALDIMRNNGVHQLFVVGADAGR